MSYALLKIVEIIGGEEVESLNFNFTLIFKKKKKVSC